MTQTTPSAGVPAWVASQRRDRGLCERCGQPPTAEVTFANTGRTELLCGQCWRKQELADQAR